MTNQTNQGAQTEESALPAELDDALFAGLRPEPPRPDRGRELALRLRRRVSKSISDHRGLTTIRHKDCAWLPVREGIRMKPLWRSPTGNSVLIEFAPGASLPVHRHRWMEEGIVLQGGLQMGDLELQAFDYHVSPKGARHSSICSRQGALAYLRGTSLGSRSGALKELLGGLLPFSGPKARTIHYDDLGWRQIAPGIFTKILASDGIRVSRFLRLEPGATLPPHEHSQPEECMMLEGDAFLGDILVRRGEYHVAASGSRHGEIMTDGGALAFLRGAST